MHPDLKEALKEERKQIEKYAKRYNIEVISACKKCGETWCSLNEWQTIKECDNCKTGDYINYYYHTEDVITVIKEMTARPKKDMSKKK